MHLMANRREILPELLDCRLTSARGWRRNSFRASMNPKTQMRRAHGLKSLIGAHARQSAGPQSWKIGLRCAKESSYDCGRARA
jgi:hypothetical protein